MHKKLPKEHKLQVSHVNSYQDTELSMYVEITLSLDLLSGYYFFVLLLFIFVKDYMHNNGLIINCEGFNIVFIAAISDVLKVGNMCCDDDYNNNINNNIKYKRDQ